MTCMAFRFKRKFNIAYQDDLLRGKPIQADNDVQPPKTSRHIRAGQTGWLHHETLVVRVNILTKFNQ